MACRGANFKTWRQDNGGPQLLAPTASRFNRPTVQVQCLFLSGAEANPVFLDTLEIVLEIFETVLEILGIVLPRTFNFKAKRTYSVKRPGNRVKIILQNPTTCPGKGVPQRIPAQSVAVILSIAPGFSSTASSQDGVTRRIPKSRIKNMLARQRLLRQQKV